MIISQHKSLSEIYSELCIRLRAIDKAESEGNTVCKSCQEKKSKHLSDGRCSSWACSMTFASAQQDEASHIRRALDLIEELTQKIPV